MAEENAQKADANKDKQNKEGKPQSALSSHAVSLSKSPLGIITIFVLLVEVMATYSISILKETDFVGHMVWFVMLFPPFILAGFFIVLWHKNRVLYAPSDFKDEKNFLELMEDIQQKQELIELKQDAVQLQLLDPDDEIGANSEDSSRELVSTIDRLLESGDVTTAIYIGRAYLQRNHYFASWMIFDYLEQKIPVDHALYTRILANRAYCNIGLGRIDNTDGYGEGDFFRLAIEDLNRVKSLRTVEEFYVWHSLALAYAYFRLGNMKEYAKWLSYSKERREYRNQLRIMREIYPEIVDELT